MTHKVPAPAPAPQPWIYRNRFLFESFWFMLLMNSKPDENFSCKVWDKGVTKCSTFNFIWSWDRNLVATGSFRPPRSESDWRAQKAPDLNPHALNTDPQLWSGSVSGCSRFATPVGSRKVTITYLMYCTVPGKFYWSIIVTNIVRTGIVDGQGAILLPLASFWSFHSTGDLPAASSSDCCLALWTLAGESAGLSGRTIRKLPFLAVAFADNAGKQQRSTCQTRLLNSFSRFIWDPHACFKGTVSRD